MIKDLKITIWLQCDFKWSTGALQCFQLGTAMPTFFISALQGPKYGSEDLEHIEWGLKYFNSSWLDYVDELTADFMILFYRSQLILWISVIIVFLQDTNEEPSWFSAGQPPHRLHLNGQVVEASLPLLLYSWHLKLEILTIENLFIFLWLILEDSVCDPIE